MICWVVERALSARNVSRAIVATDDERIVAAVKSAGYEAVLTRADHKSGTDRIAEVAASLSDAEIIVNVQGDEPLISAATIERAIVAIGGAGDWGKGKRGKRERTSDDEAGIVATEDKIALVAMEDEIGIVATEDEIGIVATEDETAIVTMEDEIGIVTTWEPIETAADVFSPDVVKVVVDDCERAIYFSRSPVPYPRDAVRAHGSLEAAMLAEPALLTNFRKHTGLYVYRRNVLLAFASWPPSELERLESLEQLRALEHGVRIKAIEASAPSIGVDTFADLERVREMIDGVSSLEFRVSG